MRLYLDIGTRKTRGDQQTAQRNAPPIACTLTGGSYDQRLRWIASLNSDGLRVHRREALSLDLHYTAAVRERVHELIRQESACCGFLTFVVDESSDGLLVTITVPERARDIVDDVLAPFLPARDSVRSSASGCTSGR